MTTHSPGNGQPSPDCATVREAVSASLDGEPALTAASDVAPHLEVCTSCRDFATEVAGLLRRTRVGAAELVPDLTEPIMRRLAAVPVSPVSSRTARLRVLVALTGVAQLLIALPLLAGVIGSDLHLGRDLASLQLALGVGLIYAAVQPRRAGGLLPVLTVVALGTLTTAGIDLITGTASWVLELTHLAELIGVAALWRLSSLALGPDVRGRVGGVPGPRRPEQSLGTA